MSIRGPGTEGYKSSCERKKLLILSIHSSDRIMRVMERTFREQLFFLVLCLSVLKGDSRYIEVILTLFLALAFELNLKACSFLQNNDISKDDLYSIFNAEFKREMPEMPEELFYRRTLRESYLTLKTYNTNDRWRTCFCYVWTNFYKQYSVNSVGPCVCAGCLDMISVEGQFTFTAERPQLNCAAFLMAEPSEVLSVEYDSVDIDCKGGDFLTVRLNFEFDHYVVSGHCNALQYFIRFFFWS